ncbi:gamma carbonic anhydrase family protein [Pueribacillus theae]|uniref:Gamma carbonic anhydrase family protein n=1 Tax=Pueribacillus theae TaxID=2171751 RepID=A0A2U1K1I7_9BACI|nr:gamma carbonic anhydrase family protein [Pueribacillus theae]PWA11115.1 gamma carbonic anhydrase family protein [Pueribacillus theae]
MKYTFNGKTPKLHPSVYVAPGAKLIGDIVLEENVSIWFNAVLRGDYEQIKIGKGSSVQDGTIVHADPDYRTTVGENVTVGHNVILHGCEVKDGALIGMGATILNGAVIGEGSLVAAGSLVPEGKVIEPGVLVAGVPAKVIRNLSEEQQKRIQQGAASYVANSRKYIEQKILEEAKSE